MRRRRLRGYTLIEVTVVIFIIGILAVILWPVYYKAREKVRVEPLLAGMQAQVKLAEVGGASVRLSETLTLTVKPLTSAAAGSLNGSFVEITDSQGTLWGYGTATGKESVSCALRDALKMVYDRYARRGMLEDLRPHLGLPSAPK